MMGSGYTLSNFGGYVGQTQSNFVDTPSKGLRHTFVSYLLTLRNAYSAFGPQPGQGLQPPSFGTAPGYTNAPPTQPQSQPQLFQSMPSYSTALPTVGQSQPFKTPSLPPSGGTVLSAAPSEIRTVTSATAKLLLLFSLFTKRGQLNADERSALKDRVLR